MLQELEKKVKHLHKEIEKNKLYLDKSGVPERIAELESQTTAEDFWQDKQAAEAIFQKLSALKSKVEIWDDLTKRIGDTSEMMELFNETSEEHEVEELAGEIAKLESDFARAEVSLLLQGEYDSSSALLSIHAGTGGVDAQDWAEMLLRMYLRFAEKQDYKAEILSISSGEEAGIKSVALHIKGPNAFGYLKSESGVHRLVRQSPFNSKNLRQTSFALVEVMPYFEHDVKIEIDKDDLRIDTFRASGHGGQKVNKTDSAVRLTHLPTGLAVSCQNERSQMQNKETAMKILKSKLFALKEAELAEVAASLKVSTQGSWGNQIRSYVLHPYQMVKDHRTNWETAQTEKVLDGEIMEFIEAYLRSRDELKKN